MSMVDIIPIVFVATVFLSIGCKLMYEYFESRST